MLYESVYWRVLGFIEGTYEIKGRCRRKYICYEFFVNENGIGGKIMGKKSLLEEKSQCFE